jgi:hypothetical protein
MHGYIYKNYINLPKIILINLATTNRQFEVVKELLLQSANINKQNKKGYTSLIQG